MKNIAAVVKKTKGNQEDAIALLLDNLTISNCDDYHDSSEKSEGKERNEEQDDNPSSTTTTTTINKNTKGDEQIERIRITEKGIEKGGQEVERKEKGEEAGEFVGQTAFGTNCSEDFMLALQLQKEVYNYKTNNFVVIIFFIYLFFFIIKKK